MDRDRLLAIVRAYYRHLDADEYASLEELLRPEFTQHRRDRTFDTRETFIAFMREDRPVEDTTHEVRAMFTGTGSYADHAAVWGQLVHPDGHTLFDFVDIHHVRQDGQIEKLYTYSNA